MACDAVLLTGTAIVNESMLTGESVPVLKSELPVSSDRYDPGRHTKFSLYSGTEVIQTRGEGSALALVIRTNFSTTKGLLVKTIMFPKPSKFQFYADSLKFVAFMACLAVVGFCVTVPFQVKWQTTKEVVERGLDIITITVPPALPAAMTIGIVFALSRLK